MSKYVKCTTLNSIIDNSDYDHYFAEEKRRGGNVIRSVDFVGCITHKNYERLLIIFFAVVKHDLSKNLLDLGGNSNFCVWIMKHNLGFFPIRK